MSLGNARRSPSSIILDHIMGNPLEGFGEAQGSAEVPEISWLSSVTFTRHDVVSLTISRNARGLVQRKYCTLVRPTQIAGSTPNLRSLTIYGMYLGRTFTNTTFASSEAFRSDLASNNKMRLSKAILWMAESEDK